MPPSQRVALFVTCIVDQALPEVGVAAVRLLRKAGYEVDFPMSQTCCGQPFFNSGFRDEARTLAQRMIEVFEPYEFVVAQRVLHGHGPRRISAPVRRAARLAPPRPAAGGQDL